MTSIKKRFTAGGLTLGLALFGLAFAPAASAQQQGQRQAQQAPQVTDEQLEEFAEIAKDVGKVRAKYEKKLSQAGAPAKARQIQQQANEEMKAVIDDHDMSIKEYNQIAQAISNDPQTAQRFRQIRQNQ